MIRLALYSLMLSSLSYGKTYVKTFKSESMTIGLEKVADGLGVPWGMAFIDSKNILVTSRSGTLYWVEGAKKTPIKGVPKVYAESQGGLLDVALDPDFKNNQTIYFTYSIAYQGGNTTRLSSAILSKYQLKNVKSIFTAEPKGSRNIHFGSRIAFDRQGYIYITVGDRGERDRAQSLDNHSGKVIRLHRDGKVPKDNPFVGKKGARPEIWSWGHRNPQGLAIHPKTGALWEQEHGPRGGDEINLIKKGVNYGWPKITYGKEYWGPSIGPSKQKGLAQPVHHYTPSIAPSGLEIYQGKAYPKWNGNIFSGAMKLTHINRLVLNGKGAVVKEERLLDDWGERIRNIKQGPDDLLYIAVDSGQILRLLPVK
ncbi:PQQ-dependent sugar dehydrogenase [Pseudobacteriovorax antillogorgiicola]|uniref:Glucose/arabinose dehydrogenase, beta-propeller fold n=1 Tax=Pseudobacteriovorax antillogorgiicola TaxID=1513793 RepID=A0A1Y6BCW8_9BACT|nr:PQQ-dependent sugar dehydrogenase [Pseudobacteriovorax antillogorgiicola]TCS56480.1 glucose/arabinose dehydrogenase [Pseudobacteriovorax antillogorgiicola]SMF04950.1 Glucose/arabinose dehydrogenase, beta-propeller fold [Pseudobacteriovorax antillogorgiicola]